MGILFRDNPHQEPLPQVWGPGLYDNYAGIRARDCYLEYLLEGRSDADATRLTIEKRDCDAYDTQTDTLMWTALAAVQLDTGSLDDAVRDGALQIMSKRDSILVVKHEEWREERAAILNDLATRLRFPAPPARMSDQALRDYCHKLWGDKWSCHVDE